jgi:hypothetical protein
MLCSSWWYAHWIINLVISGPVIFAGWALGHQVTSANFPGLHYQDHHQVMIIVLHKMGSINITTSRKLDCVFCACIASRSRLAYSSTLSACRSSRDTALLRTICMPCWGFLFLLWQLTRFVLTSSGLDHILILELGSLWLIH